MVDISVTKFKNGSFTAEEESFKPTAVEKGMISLDDATGLKMTFANSEKTEDKYYYIGEETDFFGFMDSISKNGLQSKVDLEAVKEYMNLYQINRFGLTKKDNRVIDCRPLSPQESMLSTFDELIDVFNVAYDLSTQKVLRMGSKKNNKHNN